MDSLSSDRRYSERIVFGALAAALVLGIGIYNVIPISSTDEAAATPIAVDEAAAAPADAAAPSASTVGGSLPSSQVGAVFGSAVAALESGQAADDLGLSGSGSTTGGVSTTPPPVPNPTCPTDVANDAYDSVAGPLGDAVGQQLPQDHLRVLTQIAAGCSNASPATPLIGLALDLGRLVPSTGLPNQDLSAIPAVELPPLPSAVVDALEPLRPQIMEACGTVGLLGVLVAVFPGTVGAPISGSDLADALVPAQSLCKNFEEVAG